MKQLVKISDLTNSTHQKQCLMISKSIFGDLYHNISFFEHKTNIISLVALKNETAIGFLIAHFINENKIKLDCVGVSKKFQNQKVGTQLMYYFIKNKLSDSVKIVAHAWKNKDGINAQNLNLKFGLKPLLNLGKIWVNECNKSFKCPYYEGSCTCESIEFSN